MKQLICTQKNNNNIVAMLYEHISEVMIRVGQALLKMLKHNDKHL